MFEIPIGLPPFRGHKHQITLKEGSQLVCERPYRYPYFQKSEIEKIEASQVTITESDRREVCNKIMHMLETTDSIEAKKYLQSVISSIAVSNEDVDVTLNIA